MRFVSPLLKQVFYPSLSAAGFFRRGRASGLAVVTYHGVLPQEYEPIDSALDGNLISSEAFQRQLRLLRTNYNVLSPDDVHGWLCGNSELPERAVLLTCDDGLLNNLTEMLPILQQEKLSCLFFVTGASAEDLCSTLWYEELFLLFLRARAGKFDLSCENVAISGELSGRESRRETWWSTVKRLSQVDAQTRVSFLRAAAGQLGTDLSRLDNRDAALCRRFGLLTLSELRQLAAAGMAIGAHTMSHPMLSQLPPKQARREIAECRAKLQSVLETGVWAFAYPFGDEAAVTPDDVRLAAEAGYEAAFVNVGGGLGVDLPRFALPRVHVTAEMGLTELDAHVSGFYARLQRRAGRPSPVFEAPQRQAVNQ